MTFPSLRFRYSAARFRGAATLLMFVLLGGAVTYWGIHLLYPARPSVELAPRVVERANPFSEVAARFSGALSSEGAAPMLDLRLLGLVSDGASGRAVLMKEAKPVTLGVGEALEPGVFLQRVGRDFIELDVRGATQRIELAEPHKKAKGAEK